jgi:hypothetical protein
MPAHTGRVRIVAARCECMPARHCAARAFVQAFREYLEQYASPKIDRKSSWRDVQRALEKSGGDDYARFERDLEKVSGSVQHGT